MYFDSLQAVNIREREAMPHSDIDPEDMQNGNIDPSQFKHGNMPTGGMARSHSGQGSSFDVPPSVAKHEHVIKSQSH